MRPSPQPLSSFCVSQFDQPQRVFDTISPVRCSSSAREIGPWDDYETQQPAGAPPEGSATPPPPANDTAGGGADEGSAPEKPQAPPRGTPVDLSSALLLLSFAVDGYAGMFQTGGCMTSAAAGPVLIGHFIYPAFVRVRAPTHPSDCDPPPCCLHAPQRRKWWC